MTHTPAEVAERLASYRNGRRMVRRLDGVDNVSHSSEMPGQGPFPPHASVTSTISENGPTG
jgi:hypothetical protein